MITATANVLCFVLLRFMKYNITNSIAIVSRIIRAQFRKTESVRSNSRLFETYTIRNPITSELILATNESRNALPASLYFISNMTTASETTATTIKMARIAKARPAPPASSKKIRVKNIFGKKSGYFEPAGGTNERPN